MKPTASCFLALALFATALSPTLSALSLSSVQDIFGRIKYDGVVLTSIKVKETPDSKTVTFSGSIKGSAVGETATFLHKIKQINDKDKAGKRKFQAEKLTVAEAKKIIYAAGEGGNKGKPLFCIHGFRVQPGDHLKELKNLNEKKFTKGKFVLVPVIWPSSRIEYYKDEGAALGAGKAFKALEEDIESFPSKSLLCHSMGNRVLRYAANAKFKFDNIFMVAADVRHDIFHNDYIRGNDGPEKEDGLRICRMLSDSSKGKVHVLYNGADYALTASGLPSFRKSRLGALSNNQERTRWGGWMETDLTHPEIKDSVVNKACNPHLQNWNKLAHGYQFYDFAIKYYREHQF